MSVSDSNNRKRKTNLTIRSVPHVQSPFSTAKNSNIYQKYFIIKPFEDIKIKPSMPKFTVKYEDSDILSDCSTDIYQSLPNSECNSPKAPKPKAPRLTFTSFDKQNISEFKL